VVLTVAYSNTPRACCCGHSSHACERQAPTNSSWSTVLTLLMKSGSTTGAGPAAPLACGMQTDRQTDRRHVPGPSCRALASLK
jgi:hypothetical protein